jgi:hypothetical protein
MTMRSRYIAAMLAVLVAGFGIRWLFFANQPAEAQPEAGSSATMDLFKMQKDSKDLPVLEIKDPI